MTLRAAVRSEGIALVLIVGVLTLMSVLSVSFIRVAFQLRVQASSRTDGIDARLLARSGVEYACARLSQSSVRPSLPSTVNQADDWGFRDGPGVPLEKAQNPSYAQTEPYQDVYPPGLPGIGGAGNGRFDSSVEPYTDLDGDGRFDAWSGRLRGRYGLNSGTFVLEISGEGTEGGINVNSGYMDNTNINFLTAPPSASTIPIPDYQDLGSKSGNPPITWPNPNSDALSWNRKLAFTLNQLGLLLGAATQRPGDLIVQRRPPGGYADIEEVQSHCNFLPTDWTLLRSHLSVAGRRSSYLYAMADNGTATLMCESYLRARGIFERRYTLNSSAASVETVAAAFAGIQGTTTAAVWNTGSAGPPFLPVLLTPLDALNVAKFLREQPWTSRFDLYRKLLDQAPSLFPEYSPALAGFAAPLAHALAMPEEMPPYDPTIHLAGRPPISPEQNSWMTYDTNMVRGSKESSLNAESSAKGGLDLEAGPISIFNIESRGRVTGGKGISLAAAGASGTLYREGRILEGTQYDFENIDFGVDFASAAVSPRTVREREGCVVTGRPYRDRVATFPGFSRDACRDYIDQPANLLKGYGFERLTVDYPRCYGEVMLDDRSWIDAAETFYQPCWDLEQPERTDETASLPCDFRNVAEQALHSGGGWESILLCVPLTAFTPILGTWNSGNNPFPNVFSWAPGKPFPLEQPGNGQVTCGTVEWKSLNLGAGSSPPNVYAECSKPPGFGASITASYWNWTERIGTSTTNQWPNPVLPSKDVRDHLSHAFGPDPSDPGAHPKMDAYVNGIWAGNEDFDAFSRDPTWSGKIGTANPAVDELRIYREKLTSAQIQAHAHRAWFWTADPMADPAVMKRRDLRAVPGFTSALHQFGGHGSLLAGGVQWDGFVPQSIADATDAWNQANPGEMKIPIRVELLLYADPRGIGEPIVVAFPDDSWRTGGIRTTFEALWRAVHPDPNDPPPRIGSFRYRVRLDASAMDRPQKSPVFDAIEIGFQAKRLAHYRER